MLKRHSDEVKEDDKPFRKNGVTSGEQAAEIVLRNEKFLRLLTASLENVSVKFSLQAFLISEIGGGETLVSSTYSEASGRIRAAIGTSTLSGMPFVAAVSEVSDALVFVLNFLRVMEKAMEEDDDEIIGILWSSESVDGEPLSQELLDAIEYLGWERTMLKANLSL